jgi:hypothetical protein
VAALVPYLNFRTSADMQGLGDKQFLLFSSDVRRRQKNCTISGTATLANSVGSIRHAYYRRAY